MSFKELLKDLIPPITVKVYRKLRRSHLPKNINPYYCPVCNSNIDHFKQLDDYYINMLDKHGYVHSIFCGETSNFFNYSCPACGTSDRNRLYALYFNKVFEELTAESKIYNFLDIAPDKELSPWLKNFNCLNYRSMDLMSELADDKADITNMHIYEDGRFNVVLCSHVLEHIENDRKALSEIYRILNPDGFAIIMVPISLALKENLEDPSFQSEADKWKFYGQDDHIRMYSKQGFINKLQEAGFKINQLGIDYFGKDTFKKCGIHERSILYVLKK